MTLPCIVCKRKLEAAIPEYEDGNLPYSGTRFTTSGHFGSTVFDPPVGGAYLEINICDVCLVEAGSQGFVVKSESIFRPATVNRSVWNPEEPI